MSRRMNAWINRPLMLAGTAVIGLAQPAFAQETANPISATPPETTANSSDGDIVVTAQMREQNLQDVPISMAVVSGETLTQMGVQDFTALSSYVPNLYVQPSPGNNAIYIRGIGSPPGNLAVEQTVGLFVDGLYGGRARQFQAPFLDVERVEVLRGPQGALVGKNTSAGAISVVSARPTREFTAKFQATHEFELGSTTLFGMASGPITDNLMGRVAVQMEDGGGYIHNGTLGGDEPRRESFFGRASLLYDAGAGFTLYGKIEGGYVDLTGNPIERLLNGNDPDGVRNTNGWAGWFTRDFDNTNSLNAAVVATVDIGEHVLTAISGYSHYSYLKRIDADFSPAPLFASQFTENFNQYSQEIRIASPTGGAIEYIVGGYFHRSDYRLGGESRVAAGSSIRTFNLDNTVWSGFGQMTWNVTPDLHLSGSLRYTYDRKVADQIRSRVGSPPPTWLATPLAGRRTEREWDPSINLLWEASPAVSAYITWGEGSKSGGFIGAQSATTAAQFELEPEHAQTWEAGLKFALFDRRLFLNVAAFTTKFRDLQVSSWDSASASFITTNAGQARSRGVEADMTARITDGVRLTGSLAYLDAEFLDFPGAPCPYTNPGCSPALNNAAGMPLPRTPHWSGTLNLSIRQPLNDTFTLVADGGVNFRSRSLLEESYDPRAAQPGYAKFDLRVGLQADNGRWELALLGRNLTNRHTASHAFATPFTGNVALGIPVVIGKFYEAPRTIAAQFTFNY